MDFVPNKPDKLTMAVGMGEMAISDNPNAELICMGLGSCIAVCVYIPRRRIGALAHVVLPTAPATVTEPTARYANQAITLLVRQLRQQGAAVRNARVVLCGGAAIFPPLRNTLDIGVRNLDEVMTELKRHGLAPMISEVGGTMSRTITLQVATGIVNIRTVKGGNAVTADLSAPQE